MKHAAETGRMHAIRVTNGFYKKYMSGKGLDIGYRGYSDEEVIPVLDTAIGIDLDYPGYNGKVLPFKSESQDYVFTSHVLEHIQDYKEAIVEWFRVLKPKGHMIIMVPHQFLYERKNKLPSKWNEDHKRFYTPASLLAEIEDSLPPNSYRVRHLQDGDYGFKYAVPPTEHGNGQYEIELVIQKIDPPDWDLL